jgi:hypothetical protein
MSDGVTNLANSTEIASMEALRCDSLGTGPSIGILHDTGRQRSKGVRF